MDKVDNIWRRKRRKKIWSTEEKRNIEGKGGKYLEKEKEENTRSSWLNCALRDHEAVNWASIGHYEATAVGN